MCRNRHSAASEIRSVACDRSVLLPKLTIADGRKFLRSVPEGTYDLVVMNTSWHWRSYISLLLSREFLTLVQTRMAPAALLAYNSTESPDALNTAVAVFPHAYLYDNFVICSDSDWRAKLDEQSSVDELLKIRPEGKPLFSDSDGPLMRDFLSRDHTATVEEIAAKTGRPLEIITTAIPSQNTNTGCLCFDAKVGV
jgi:hypothetical protein